jgi:hypothetical protein
MIESRSYRANPSIWFANAASHVQNMQKELTKMDLAASPGRCRHHRRDQTSHQPPHLRASVCPAVLAFLRDTCCDASVETIAKALTGNYR